MTEYERWLAQPLEDKELTAELESSGVIVRKHPWVSARQACAACSAPERTA